MPAAHGGCGITVLRPSTRNVQSDEEQRCGCEEGAAEAQQKTVQQRQSDIHGPLPVQGDGSPLHNQIQVTPCQIAN